jgi:predicted DNA-binding protein with PD1-like motif
VLILGTGDEVVSGLLALAQQEKLESARFTAIGGISQAEFGYFELAKKKYKAFRYERQLEVLSLAGDIALDPEGKPTVHAHVVLGDVDGRAIGGHLISALVRPTLEVFVNVYPSPLHKREEPETETQVIDLDKAPPGRAAQ